MMRRLTSLLYAIAIHGLAFWTALFVSFVVGGKAPNVAFIIVPAFLVAYFAAGWISQRRTPDGHIATVTIAAFLSSLLLPTIIYLNQFEMDAEPVNWSTALWLSPCVLCSIAGVRAARYNSRTEFNTVASRE